MPLKPDNTGRAGPTTGNKPQTTQPATDPVNRSGPVVETDKSKQPEAKDNKDTFNPTDAPGFHLVRSDGEYLGTYETEEAAQMHMDGQLGDVKAKIVEGHAPTTSAPVNSADGSPMPEAAATTR